MSKFQAADIEQHEETDTDEVTVNHIAEDENDDSALLWQSDLSEASDKDDDDDEETDDEKETREPAGEGIDDDSVKSEDVKEEPKTAIKSLIEQKLIESKDFVAELSEANQEVFTNLLGGVVSLYEAEVIKLREETEASIAKEKERLEESVSLNMDYLSDRWLQENEVAIQEQKTVDTATAILEGVKKLLIDNAIILESDMKEPLYNLKSELAEASTLNAQLIEENEAKALLIRQLERKVTFLEGTEGLSLNQRDALSEMIVPLVTDTMELSEYVSRLDYIKKKFFEDAEHAKDVKELVDSISESREIEVSNEVMKSITEDKTDTVNVDPSIARYLNFNKKQMA